MKLFVPRELKTETRVALSPDMVKRLISLGFEVTVEKSAGEHSRITDEAFRNAGAKIGSASSGSSADVVLKINRPTPSEAKGYKKGALVLAAMDPHGNEADLKAMAAAGLTAFAMEFMPRITRAQSMDILSSQANLAGYQAVIEGSAAFDRALPMMMTAAGTVPAAKVFVMGAGVAGLQAIATARRLGAVVTATDVRAAAAEQVASLGGKFIMTDALKDASGEGGYARELTADEQKAQAELVASHISKQDIVITTALIPGRPAPRLVTKAMTDTMMPGSVLVDLAVERGGNVEGAIAGKVVRSGPVSIVGHENMAGRIPATASILFAKNLVTFLETMVDGENKNIKINRDDELVKATMLTDGGKIVHPLFASGTPTKAAGTGTIKAEVKKPVAKKSTAKAGAKGDAK